MPSSIAIRLGRMERWFLPSIFFMLKDPLHCLHLATHHGGNERRDPQQSLRCPTQHRSHLSGQCRFLPRQSSLLALLAKVAAVLCGESRSQWPDLQRAGGSFLARRGGRREGVCSRYLGRKGGGSPVVGPRRNLPKRRPFARRQSSSTTSLARRRGGATASRRTTRQRGSKTGRCL
jgi:hypothetical protein